MSLLWPHTGYLQTFSRLVFLASTVLPIGWVAFFGTVMALLARAAVVAFLWSSRFSWLDGGARFLLSLYMLLMPGLSEVHANVTNTHWYIGLYGLMVLLADAPRSRTAKTHDIIALVLFGLSGPFAIFALPVVGLRWYFARSQFGRDDAIVSCLALLQLSLIMFSGDVRTGGSLGADLALFLQILSGRILAGSFLPADVSTAVVQSWFWIIVLLVLGSWATAITVWKWGWRPLALFLFAGALLGAALASPASLSTEPQWPMLLTAAAARYYVVPHIAVFVAILGLCGSFAKKNAVALCTFGFILIVLLAPFLQLPPVAGPSFAKSAALFEEASPGEIVQIPISPPGWEMTITKHLADGSSQMLTAASDLGTLLKDEQFPPICRRTNGLFQHPSAQGDRSDLGPLGPCLRRPRTNRASEGPRGVLFLRPCGCRSLFRH
jgi:hypothetical protein